jgi:hypothetical protein
VDARGRDVFMQTLGGGRPLLLFSSIRSEQSVAVAASAVYAVTRSAASGHWGLAAWRYADRKIVPVAEYAREAGDGIAISPDERSALLTQQEHQVLDLMLLDGVDFLRR